MDEQRVARCHAQLAGRCRGLAFIEQVAVLHSNLSQGERFDEWTTRSETVLWHE